MKTASHVLALLAYGSLLLAPSSVCGAECSEADLNVYAKLAGDTNAEQACAALLKVGTKVDATTLATLNPCDDATCLAYFEQFANDLTDCTVSGFPLRQPFDALLAVCKRKPGGPPPPPISMTTTAPPSTGTTTTSPASSASNSSSTTAPAATPSAAPVATPAPAATSSAAGRTTATVAVVVAASTLAGLLTV